MASEAMQRVLGDLKSLAQHTRELIAQTAGDSGERLRSARERAQATLAELQPHIDNLEDAANARGRAASAYAHDHPAQVIAALAVVALIAGLMLVRR
jgi:ElaB/YqjD/DUF883 family membrane-anchored ribosome-binding protein